MNNTEVIAILLYNNPGGRIVGGMILGLIIGIISLVYNSTKKHIEKEKLKKNPNDVSLLERKALKELEIGYTIEAQELLEKISEIDKLNFLANLYLSIIYHKQEDYIKSKYYLRILIDDVVATDEIIAEYYKEVALAYYYWGHIHHLDGNFNEAEKWKKEAIDTYKRVNKENLY